MDIFVHDDDWNEQFISPEEWAGENALADGDTFALVRATIHAKTTYRMEGGRAVPKSLAFPDPLGHNCPKCGNSAGNENFEPRWWCCKECQYEWVVDVPNA